MRTYSNRSQGGIALITVMLIMLLMSALLVGFTVSVMSEARLSGIDKDYKRAFYGAQAGMEQLTANLGTLFAANYAPTTAQVNGLTATPPVLPGITFIAPGGAAGSGYQIQFPIDPVTGNPGTQTRTILSGPYQGFVGLVTPYTMQITAQTNTGYEVRLVRTVQTVAIPVFQFGVFSEPDLSYFPGPIFNFGGRVHSNANLFLAAGSGLTINDRVTAVGEIVRGNLANGVSTGVAHSGPVNLLVSGGLTRDLQETEGSVVGMPGSAVNEPLWTNLSIGTYNGNVRNGRTGARRLDLPLVSLGATPIDLIRRAVPNEDTTNAAVLQQRYFWMASLRILLSDTAADILNLPTVTPTPPVRLVGIPAGVTTGIPFATSSGTVAEGYRSAAGTGLIDGFLKIEMQDNAGVWTDVTLEILNLGYAGRNPHLTAGCVEWATNAILRFQRVRDDSTACNVGTTVSTNYWPMVLYDTREGNLRDNIATGTLTVFLGGVMHYVELDVRNLTRWFQGAIGVSGPNAMNVTGYVVYFSDRRNNRNAASQETGEYGFEDFVNPLSASGTPNNVLDQGEDVNGNSVAAPPVPGPEIYGTIPNYNGVYNSLPPGASAPLDATARPWTAVAANVAKVNRPILFRRALKLTNGALGNIILPGLAVVAENPIYVQGNYNANAGGFGNPHAACSVIGDTVTLLSNSWNDLRSFTSPHNPAGRVATTTWYRTAIISGKGLSFPQPAGTATDFGTDGGVHNFLRYIERWSGQTLWYRGSIVSFYFNRQANGVYKCCTNVYSPPTRGYNFDVEFLTPSLLPPRTPMFRDVNATGFSQVILPN
jgi:hypothetical protein